MTGSVDRKKEIRLGSHIFYAAFFSAFILCCAIIQCSDIKLFGVLPEVTFGTVCAIGFVAKEKYGGIFGLCGGILVMALGSSGISFAPILYTLCGYLSGALPGIILRRNFLSYLIFAPIMAATHIFFTFVYYLIISRSPQMWGQIGKLIIPEFFSCIICMIPAYFAVLGVYALFKGKNNRKGSLK